MGNSWKCASEMLNELTLMKPKGKGGIIACKKIKGEIFGAIRAYKPEKRSASFLVVHGSGHIQIVSEAEAKAAVSAAKRATRKAGKVGRK